MQFINHILSGSALFAFTTFAAPTERATTIPDFQITALETHRTSNATGAGQNVTVCFAVTDPSTSGNSTTTCNATWTLGSAYPQDSYTPCLNSNFSWNFEDGSYTNLYQFTLQVQHSYINPAISDWPTIYFSHANVTHDNMHCRHGRHGAYGCVQHGNSSIDAPVWATIA